MDFDLKLLQWPAIPFTCQIFGQSVSKKKRKKFFSSLQWRFFVFQFCGKTHFICEQILNENFTFERPPEKYVYVYAFWNEKFDRLKKVLKNRIVFVENYPGLKLFNQYGMSGRTAENGVGRICVILDDQDALLFNKKTGDRDAEIIVNQIVHHKRLMLFCISHNLIKDSPVFRNFARSATFNLLFDSIRSRGSIRYLSRVLFSKSNFLIDVLNDVKKRNLAVKCPPILIDFRLDIHPLLRVREPLGQNRIIYLYAIDEKWAFLNGRTVCYWYLSARLTVSFIIC